MKKLSVITCLLILLIGCEPFRLTPLTINNNPEIVITKENATISFTAGKVSRMESVALTIQAPAGVQFHFDSLQVIPYPDTTRITKAYVVFNGTECTRKRVTLKKQSDITLSFSREQVAGRQYLKLLPGRFITYQDAPVLTDTLTIALP